jgi:hypothetical protein
MAPDNLPVAENIFSLEEKDLKKNKEGSSTVSVVKEATLEEVKERLNKLLSGEI